MVFELVCANSESVRLCSARSIALFIFRIRILGVFIFMERKFTNLFKTIVYCGRNHNTQYCGI